MFGRKTEKRVLREADKIVSLKEDMDALSWGRVLEIGKQLEGFDDGVLAAHGRELVAIAQSNLSLYSRLGIDPVPNRVMASGIEVMEGGLAEAALEEPKPSLSVPSPLQVEAATTVEPDVPVADPLATSDALSSLLESVMSAPVEDPCEEDFEAAMVHEELKSVADNDPDEGDFSAVEAEVAVEADTLDEHAEPEPTLTIADILDSLPPIPAVEPEEEQAEAACANDAETSAEAPAEEVHSEAPSAKEEASPIPEEPRQSEQPAKQKQRQFARFRNLYESRDGGLCVFEDEHGHLVAIDSSKLA